MISLMSLSRKNIVNAVFGNKGIAYFWEARFLPRWLPLLLGLGLGVLLASLIVDEAWYFLGPVVLAIPTIVLLSRYPFAAVMLWMLLFAYVGRGTGGAGGRYIYWIFHRAMIPATLGLVILADWLKIRKRERVQLGLAELAMLIFLGLVLANIVLLTQGFQQRLYRLFDRAFVPFCMYWLIRLIAPSEEDLKRFLWVAFITLAVQCSIGLFAWFAPQMLPPEWIKGGGERTVGTLGKAAVYTSTLIFLSLLLFQYAMTCRSRWLRVVLISAFGLAFFCVFLSFSRGSWVGGAMVLVGLLFVYPKVVIRVVAIVTIVTYMLGSSVLADDMAFAWERLTGEKSRQTAESRMIANQASIQMIEAKPLWGWGFDNYNLYDRQFQTRVGNIPVRHDVSSHNTYLTIMAEMGLIAFLFYMLPVGWWLMAGIKTWRKLPGDGFWSRQLLVLLWLLIFDHFIVSNFMDMFKWDQFGTTVWWMALGFIANMVYPYLKQGNLAVRN